MQNPEPPEKSKTGHPFSPVEIWRREWPVVKSTPTASVICFGIGCLLFWFFYNTFIIPGKDSTIQSLQLQSGVGNHSGTVTNTIYSTVTNTFQSPHWYLKIRGAEITKPVPPNGMQSSFRIIASVNGQEFSYPTESIWISAGVPREESFPLPLGADNYLVNFDGMILRDNGDPALFQEIKSDHYDIKSLPSGVQTNRIKVSSPMSASDPNTAVTIFYEISTNY